MMPQMVACSRNCFDDLIQRWLRRKRRVSRGQVSSIVVRLRNPEMLAAMMRSTGFLIV